MRPAGFVVMLCLVAQGPAGCGSVPPQSDTDARSEQLAELSQRAGRAVARGEIARAARHYQEALRIAESVEDFRAIGLCALNLAATYQALDRNDLALAAVGKILAAPARFETEVVAEAAGRRALLALQDGQLDAAAQWLEQAELDCAPPACRIRVALHNLRGQLMLERGTAAEARGVLSRALAEARAEGNSEEEANALRVDGRAAARLGEHAQAVAALTQALEIDKRLALPRKIALDLQALAEVELARGNPIAARDYAQRALDVSRAAGRKAQQDAAQRLLERIP